MEIDGSQPALLGGTNASISDLGPSVAGEALTLSWTQTDGSLPIPIDPTDAVTGLCLRVSDLLQILDQQTIRIANLRPGRYLLRIDEQDIGAFSADDLTRTIDLAGVQTPMASQALRTHYYTIQHNQLHYVKWRQLQLPYLVDDLASYAAVLGSVDSMENEILGLQRSTSVTAPHRITIVGADTAGVARASKFKQ